MQACNPIVRRNALAIARGTASDAQIKQSHHPVPAYVRDATEVLRAHDLIAEIEVVRPHADLHEPLHEVAHRVGTVVHAP